MEIIEKNRRGILYYQFERFNELNFIDHLFTSRIGWNNGNIPDKLSEILNMPKSNQVNLKQVHGTNIILVDSNDDFKELSKIEGDGLITNIPNIILSTNHADCVPIYFIDQIKKVVGVAHGGWRGTYENISGKMIDKMKEVYGSESGDILVGIGPSIGPCCYEVGKDLGEQFKERYPRFSNILMEKDDKTFLDLWEVNYLQVKDRGVREENIVVSKACTSCNVDKFHSYRREKGTKERLVAAIGLKNNA